MKKNSKIYITGASGMVGRNLIEELKKRGYKNLIYNNSQHLDLRDREKVFHFFKREKPEFVFHLAAKVGGIKANMDNPVNFLKDNLLLNTNVIDACFTYKVKKLINLGSSCIYPKNITYAMGEDCLLQGKLEKTNEGYALSKICSLKLCQYYNEQYKTSFITLMPPNLYGEYDHFELEKSHVISALITKLHIAKTNKKKEVEVWGTGNVRREFLYVKDFINILIYATQNIQVKDLYDKCFLNCGNEKDITIKELSALIKKIIGYKGKMVFNASKPEGIKRKLMDSKRFNNLYKDMKYTDFEKSLLKTYQFLLKQPS